MHYNADRVAFLLGFNNICEHVKANKAPATEGVNVIIRRVQYYFKNTNYMAAVTAFRENDSFYTSMSMNHNMESIEEDYDMNLLKENTDNDFLDRVNVGDQNPTLQSLDKMLPYGVKSVHVDVVSPAPRTAHPVTLCVVDSGIFRDYNYFPEEFISGNDSVSAKQWDADVNGHGAHVAVAT